MVRNSLAVTVVAVALLVVACPAFAQRADTIRRFPIPTHMSGPSSIVAGPQGKLWFSEQDASKIGAINVRTHHISERQVSMNAGAVDAIAVGPGGKLWFTGGMLEVPNPAIPDSVLIMGTVAELDPATHVLTQIPFPNTNRYRGAAIALGSDGNFWFTEESGLELGTVNPRTHAASTFTLPLPLGGYTLGGIVNGPDGDLWITEVKPFGGAIERLNPVTHAVAEYPLAGRGAAPGAITVGPDGSLWFTDRQLLAGSIGVFNRRTRAITEFALPYPATPAGIAAGPDGNIWFTTVDRGQVGVLDPTTGAIRVFPAPFTLAGAGAITTGPDGNMWFTQASQAMLSDAIGVVTVGSGPPQMATCATARVGTPQRCRLAPLRRPVTFPPGASIAHLTRSGKLYASGSATGPRGALRLMLVPQHALAAGTYRLALTSRGHTRHETLTLAS